MSKKLKKFASIILLAALALPAVSLAYWQPPQPPQPPQPLKAYRPDLKLSPQEAWEAGGAQNWLNQARQWRPPQIPWHPWRR